MSQTLLRRIRSAATLLRPRTITLVLRRLDRLQASVARLQHDMPRVIDATSRVAQGLERLDERSARRDAALKQVRHDVAAAAKREAELTRRTELLEMITELGTLSKELGNVRSAVLNLSARLDQHARQTEQLFQVHRLDERQQRLVRKWESTDFEAVKRYVRASIERAVVHEHPFPHAVIDSLLPDKVYALVIEALPPRVFFEDKIVNKQQLAVPFGLAPRYSRIVWQFVIDLVDDVIGPDLQRKFQTHIDRYLASICPAAVGDATIGMTVSDGRIMLRRPGYVINPHRDPKWGFLTTLMYLARPGDEESYGTQLYTVHDDAEAPSEAHLYVEPGRCELAGTIPFRRNTALVFLNSHGAHGASIPPDAPPETERYLYQFRIGPDGPNIRKILALMPESSRALWTGSKHQKLATIDGGY